MEFPSEQSEPLPLTLAEFIRSCVRAVLLGVTIAVGWLAYRRHLLAKPALPRRARAAWMSGVARRVVRLLGVRFIVKGRVPEAGLIISNHLSYLDIAVLNAVTRCLFVSKAEVANYPIFGECGRWAGIVFVDRQRRSAVAEVAAQMREVLVDGVPLVLFPEGTTSNGDGVLPFKPSLLASVIEVESPVTPCALDYSVPGGSARDEICYWGGARLRPHLMHLLGKVEIEASLRFGEPFIPRGDRKEIARRLHAEVSSLRQRQR